MKQKIGFVILLGLLFSACNKEKITQDVPGCTDPSSLNYNPDATVNDNTCLVPLKKQWGFVLEYTATTCGVCGSSGTVKVHEMYKKGNVVAICCHTGGDPMHNAQLYGSFSGDRPTNGFIPYFWVGDKAEGEITDLDALLNHSPDAGIIFVSERKSDKIEVKSLVKFFNNVSGEYYLSFFLLESGIDGTSGEYDQQGAGDDYKHDFVLRGTATQNSVYGEKLVSGSVAAESLISKNATLYVDPSWTKDVYVAAVLWKKNGNKFEYVNAYEVGTHSYN